MTILRLLLAAAVLAVLLGAVFLTRKVRPASAPPVVVVETPEQTVPPEEMGPVSSPPTREDGTAVVTTTPVTDARPEEVDDSAASLSDRLAALRARLEVLPEYDGTFEPIRRKYEGLEPEDLEMLLPTLRRLRKKEMFAALDDAVRTGRAVITPPGEPLDHSRHARPGSTVSAVASRTNGKEQQALFFGPDVYPEVYVRILEETWVGERIDEAGRSAFVSGDD